MGKPSYGEFSFPSDYGFSGSDGKTMVRGYARGGAKKPVKKQIGGEVVAEESMQGRLPQNAAMAARDQAGRIPRQVNPALTEGERMRIAEAKARRRGSEGSDAEVERTQEENFERVRRKYGEKPIRREKGGDVKQDKQMIAAAIKEHAQKPASKAHRGLKYGGKAVPVHSATPKIK